jgi:hypothetical protein
MLLGRKNRISHSAQEFTNRLQPLLTTQPAADRKTEALGVRCRKVYSTTVKENRIEISLSFFLQHHLLNGQRQEKPSAK